MRRSRTFYGHSAPKCSKGLRSESRKPFAFIKKSGAPGGTRTPDLLVRSQTLYPTELRAHSDELNFSTAPRNPATGRYRFRVSSVEAQHAAMCRASGAPDCLDHVFPGLTA